MSSPSTARLVTYAQAPFGVNATAFPNLDIDPATGNIVLVAWVPFDVEAELTYINLTPDQPGGWLRDEEDHKRAKKRNKIKLKRERRQEYVLRKVYAELKDLEPDEFLLALMAEFETVEDVFKSDADIQGQLRQAYYDYIITRQEAQAAQDQEDEMAIILALSETL
jgi:hypothetical protein